MQFSRSIDSKDTAYIFAVTAKSNIFYNYLYCIYSWHIARYADLANCYKYEVNKRLKIFQKHNTTTVTDFITKSNQEHHNTNRIRANVYIKRIPNRSELNLNKVVNIFELQSIHARSTSRRSMQLNQTFSSQIERLSVVHIIQLEIMTKSWNSFSFAESTRVVKFLPKA